VVRGEEYYCEKVKRPKIEQVSYPPETESVKTTGNSEKRLDNKCLQM